MSTRTGPSRSPSPSTSGRARSRRGSSPRRPVARFRPRGIPDAVDPATAGRNRARASGGPRSSARFARSIRSEWRDPGDRRRRSRPDARAVRPRRGHPAERSPGSTRGRPRGRGADRRDRRRGWALGGLPAALWVERHEPAVAAATRWYLTTWEWLAFRLAGDARAPLVADQLVPDPAAVTAAGVPAGKLPPLGRTGEPVGSLTSAAADALGLRAGIPVIGGTVDAFASYHGAGLLEPGDAYDPAARPAASACTGTTGRGGRRLRHAGASRRAYSASGRPWPRPAGPSTGIATCSSAAR